LSESHGDERRFYQGLIQAAVGLFHFGNGNLGGAAKLYRSSRDYMRPCGSPFLGLDVDAFWRRMEECFRPLLSTDIPTGRRARPGPGRRSRPGPGPGAWPDPEDFVPPRADAAWEPR